MAGFRTCLKTSEVSTFAWIAYTHAVKTVATWSLYQRVGVFAAHASKPKAKDQLWIDNASVCRHGSPE